VRSATSGLGGGEFQRTRVAEVVDGRPVELHYRDLDESAPVAPAKEGAFATSSGAVIWPASRPHVWSRTGRHSGLLRGFAAQPAIRRLRQRARTTDGLEGSALTLSYARKAHADKGTRQLLWGRRGASFFFFFFWSPAARRRSTPSWRNRREVGHELRS